MKPLTLRRRIYYGLAMLMVAVVGLPAILSGHVSAGPNFPAQQASGSIGVEGSISTAAPTRGASITTPVNGAVFNSLPITVNGLCPKGLLVKLFSNNVFVGSSVCANGSYSIQIDLFSGQNDLVARVYDALDQAGPDSNVVAVTYHDAQYASLGSRITLTTSYAERGANPGDELTWPIVLSGGAGPYAISVDWGDASPQDLISLSATGGFTIKHAYKSAGTYTVIIKGTDANGVTAILQVVAIANGATADSAKKGGSGASTTKTIVLWWPAIAMIPLLFAAFWVGKRSELYQLRKQLDKSRRENK